MRTPGPICTSHVPFCMAQGPETQNLSPTAQLQAKPKATPWAGKASVPREPSPGRVNAHLAPQPSLALLCRDIHLMQLGIGRSPSAAAPAGNTDVDGPGPGPRSCGAQLFPPQTRSLQVCAPRPLPCCSCAWGCGAKRLQLG